MFNKNEIKSIPFNLIPQEIKNLTNTLVSEKVHDVYNSLVRAYEARVQKVTRLSSQFSESNEGIEEGVREALAPPDLDSIQLPDEEIQNIQRSVRNDVVEAFISKYQLAVKHTWLMPQMLAHFGRWTPVRNTDGQISGKTTVVENCTTDWEKGLYLIATTRRGTLLKNCGTPMYQLPMYGSLVPLIMAGLKTSRDISYNEWSREDVRYVVDPDLYAGMTCTFPDISTEELLEIRTKGLTVASGKTMGKVNNPVTQFKLTGIADTELSGLPWYGQVMMAQIWCAHPANRSHYMILDPIDWDKMPKALINDSVVTSSSAPKSLRATKIASNDIPWDF
jgi:hypothetical protein